MSILASIRAAMLAPERTEDEDSVPSSTALRKPSGSAAPAAPVATFDRDAAIKVGRDSERARLSAALGAPGIKGNAKAMSAVVDLADLMPSASSSDLVARAKAGPVQRKESGEGRLLALAEAQYGPRGPIEKDRDGADRMSANMRGVIAEGSSRDAGSGSRLVAMARSLYGKKNAE